MANGAIHQGRGRQVSGACGCGQDHGPGAVKAVSCMGPQPESRRKPKGVHQRCCCSSIAGWTIRWPAWLVGRELGLAGRSSPHIHQQPPPQNSLPVPALQ